MVRTNRSSIIPTDQVAEAIEQLEQVRGILECLERLGDGDPLVHHMAQASAGAAQLVVQAQAVLIEAHVVEGGQHG